MAHALATAAIALIGGLVGTGLVRAQDADELFAFRRAVVEKGGHGVGFEHPELTCVAPLKVLGSETRDDVYFIAERGQPTEVWAAAQFPLSSLGDLWTGGDLGEGTDHPKTAEWGWMYDRNGDSKVDWLAYIADTATVLPEGGFQKGFPNVAPKRSDGSVVIPKAQNEIRMNHVRGSYRNFIDSDFDGVLDRVITVPISDDNGWHEGSMLVSFKGLAMTDCIWQSDYDAADTQACTQSEDSVVTQGGGPTRRSSLPHAGWAQMADGVIEAAGQCDFGRSGIASRP